MKGSCLCSTKGLICSIAAPSWRLKWNYPHMEPAAGAHFVSTTQTEPNTGFSLTFPEPLSALPVSNPSCVLGGFLEIHMRANKDGFGICSAWKRVIQFILHIAKMITAVVAVHFVARSRQRRVIVFFYRHPRIPSMSWGCKGKRRSVTI